MSGPDSSRRRSTPAIFTGLAVAWGGTAFLLGPAARLIGNPGRLSTEVIGQAVLWLIALAVLAIMRFWERQPLPSLWLKPFQWQSAGWGVLLAAVHFVVLFPLGEVVRRAAGLPGFAAGMEPLMALPLWYRVFAGLGAGVVEEILFRGYAVTRLTILTGRPWVAATIALVAFSLLHVPHWGWGFVVGGLIGGVVTMAFFVWRRDLLAMIVFHTIADTAGIVVAPLFSAWWR